MEVLEVPKERAFVEFVDQKEENIARDGDTLQEVQVVQPKGVEEEEKTTESTEIKSDSVSPPKIEGSIPPQ